MAEALFRGAMGSSLGVTTAATLWFVTVIGLCFGVADCTRHAAFALGMLVLSGLRWFDYRMKQEQHRVLYLTTERHEPGQETIRAMVRKAGYDIIGVSSVARNNQTQTRELEFKLQWRSAPHNVDVPPFLPDLSSDPHVATAPWKVS